MPLRLGGHTDLGSGMTAYSDKQAGSAGEQNKEIERKKNHMAPERPRETALVPDNFLVPSLYPYLAV